MDENYEKATLSKILTELEVISGKNKKYWFREFLGGALRGIGFFIGSVLGIVLLGWALSFLGVIPGLKQLSQQIKGATEAQASTTIPSGLNNNIR